MCCFTKCLLTCRFFASSTPPSSEVKLEEESTCGQSASPTTIQSIEKPEQKEISSNKKKIQNFFTSPTEKGNDSKTESSPGSAFSWSKLKMMKKSDSFDKSKTPDSAIKSQFKRVVSSSGLKQYFAKTEKKESDESQSRTVECDDSVVCDSQSSDISYSQESNTYSIDSFCLAGSQTMSESGGSQRLDSFAYRSSPLEEDGGREWEQNADHVDSRLQDSSPKVLTECLLLFMCSGGKIDCFNYPLCNGLQNDVLIVALLWHLQSVLLSVIIVCVYSFEQNRDCLVHLHETWMFLSILGNLVFVSHMNFNRVGTALIIPQTKLGDILESPCLSRVNLTLAITFELKEKRLSYYTCVFLVTRPFSPYQKF